MFAPLFFGLIPLGIVLQIYYAPMVNFVICADGSGLSSAALPLLTSTSSYHSDVRYFDDELSPDQIAMLTGTRARDDDRHHMDVGSMADREGYSTWVPLSEDQSSSLDCSLPSSSQHVSLPSASSDFLHTDDHPINANAFVHAPVLPPGANPLDYLPKGIIVLDFFPQKYTLIFFPFLTLSCTPLHFFYLIFLSVPPTPYVPVAKGCSNRKMRMAIRRHRALLRAGFRAGHVELPLPKEFVNVLKRKFLLLVIHICYLSP